MKPSVPWLIPMRAPVVRIMLPVIAGMVVAMLVHPSLVPVAWAFGIISLATAVVLLRRFHYGFRWVRGQVFLLWCLVAGMFWATLRDPAQAPGHVAQAPEGEGLWSMRIDALNGMSPALLRADAHVLARHDGSTWQPCHGRVMLSLLRGADGAALAPGDEILVRAALEPIDRSPDPGGFDRTAWAAVRGLHQELFAPREDWHRTGHRWHWTEVFATMRDRISFWLKDSGLPDRERALVKALVLGLREDLQPDQQEAFIRSGTVHILAVSGSHVGFIYAMLLFLFRWWGEAPRVRIRRGVVVLLVLWAYAGLTGAAPSVLRATVMFSLFTLASMFARRSTALNNLFFAALVLLAWEPRMLLDLGFQLSFLAVLGIVLFHRPLFGLWAPKWKVVRHLWELCALSIAAQLFTTPLSLYVFKAFPVWFLPANLAVVTLAAFAVYGGVALLLLYRVPWLGEVITWLLTRLVRAVGALTEFFAHAPGAYPPVRFGMPELLLSYALVLALLLRWPWRWKGGTRLGLASLAALLLVCAWRTRSLHDRSELVVYDDRHALQAAMVIGREHVLLAHPDSFAADHWLQQKALRHRRAAGLDLPLLLPPEALHGGEVVRAGHSRAGEGRWSAAGIDAVFIGPEARLPQRPERFQADVVVLHGIHRLDSTVLDGLAGLADRLVLAGDNHWRVRRKVRGWCAANGIACHDVRDDGAFILQR